MCFLFPCPWASLHACPVASSLEGKSWVCTGIAEVPLKQIRSWCAVNPDRHEVKESFPRSLGGPRCLAGLHHSSPDSCLYSGICCSVPPQPGAQNFRGRSPAKKERADPSRVPGTPSLCRIFLGPLCPWGSGSACQGILGPGRWGQAVFPVGSPGPAGGGVGGAGLHPLAGTGLVSGVWELRGSSRLLFCVLVCRGSLVGD